MSLEVGKTYCRLSNDDFNRLTEALSDPSYTFDLLSDFFDGHDGYHYALPDSVDTDERDFILELGLDSFGEMPYILSTHTPGTPGGN